MADWRHGLLEGEEARGGHHHLGRGVEGLRRGQPPPRPPAGEGGAGLLREGGRGRPRTSRWPSPSSRSSRATSATSTRRAPTRRRRWRRPANLPPGERFYIEGRHYSLDPATIEKAIEAYQRAVDEAPEPDRGAQQPGPAASRDAALPRGARAPRGAAPARDDVPGQLHEPGPGLRGHRPPGQGARGARRVRGRAPGPRGQLREPRLLRADPGPDRGRARRVRQGGALCTPTTR